MDFFDRSNTFTPIRQETGEPHGFVGISEDILADVKHEHIDIKAIEVLFGALRLHHLKLRINPPKPVTVWRIHAEFQMVEAAGIE